MLSDPPRSVVVDAPGTIGNFGPGFDVISLAVHGLGDRIELAPADDDQLVVDGPGADGIPRAWSENTATGTLDWLRSHTGIQDPLRVSLDKRMPGGSGMGSSASSAGGAALAFHALYPDAELDPVTLVQAAGAGEAAARAEHVDDVASVVLGGLAIVRTGDGRPSLQRVQPPEELHLALLAPALELRTAAMRDVLPPEVPLRDAVATMGNLAALVDAFHREDVATIGACLEDHVAAPHRLARIPFFADVRRAGLEAGAFGVALSGSGPALVAVADAAKRAQRVADAMADASEDTGVEARTFVAEPERDVMHREVQLR